MKKKLRYFIFILLGFAAMACSEENIQPNTGFNHDDLVDLGDESTYTVDHPKEIERD